MKNLLCFFLTLLLTQFATAQTNKRIDGKVVFNKNPLRDVEVINWNKKTITKSDSDGNFQLEVSLKDSLFFLSKNHLDKKIGINKIDYDEATIVITMIEKTVDLEEIKIIKNQSTGFKVEQKDIDEAILLKKEARPESKEVDMGTINQGMDFVRIFKDLKKLFKKDSDKNEQKSIAFSKYIASNFETEYFVKNLELKPDEINKFIAFCNEDIEAPRLAELSNILTMMDFLNKKNIEFKSL